MCLRSPPPLLLPLLLPLLARPDPVPAEGCDLRPVAAEPPVTLSYSTGTVPRGCVSSSSLHSANEVHVLGVQWSKVPAVVLKVSVTPPASGCARPAVLVLQCSRCLASITSLCPDLLVLTDATLSPGSTTVPHRELPAAASKGQLLDWARGTYGGITSYSELRDPRAIHLRLGEDARSPPDCIPQERFNAAPHLDAEVFFHGMRGCASGGAHGSRAAHIIRLQPEHSSPVTEVNLSLSCPERAVSNQILILQSRANLTWFLSLNGCHIQFLVSGTYKITSFLTHLFSGELLPDTEQGLVAKAFEKNYSVIASYSTIPISPRITLEIQEHEVLRKPPATPTPPAPTSDTLPHVLLLMLQPWKCTDDTMEIIIARSHLEPIKDVVNITLRDISCQAEKNATHFMLRTLLSHCGTSLESQGNAKNELILSLSKGSALRSVRVAFQCQIPRELFLRLFPTAAFEAPQTELEVNKEAFVQVPQRPGTAGTVPRGGIPHGDPVPPPPAGVHALGRLPGRPAAQGVLAGGTGDGAAAAGAGQQGTELQRGRAGGAPRQQGQEGLAIPLHLRRPRGRPRPLLRHPQVQGRAAEQHHLREGFGGDSEGRLAAAQQPRAGAGRRAGHHLRSLPHRGAPHRRALVHLLAHPSHLQTAAGLHHGAGLGEQQHQPQHRQHPEHPLLHQQHGLTPPGPPSPPPPPQPP